MSGPLAKQVARLEARLLEKQGQLDEADSKILLLEQINNEVTLKEQETGRICNEKIKELRELLERKETMFQAKEKKWADVEKILVTYARKDMELRQKLTDIKYICDDPSSKRQITTVLNENEVLKRKVENAEKELELMRSQLTMQTEMGNSAEDFSYDGGSMVLRTMGHAPRRKVKSMAGAGGRGRQMNPGMDVKPVKEEDGESDDQACVACRLRRTKIQELKEELARVRDKCI
jgi:hypothetical protein